MITRSEPSCTRLAEKSGLAEHPLDGRAGVLKANETLLEDLVEPTP